MYSATLTLHPLVSTIVTGGIVIACPTLPSIIHAEPTSSSTDLQVVLPKLSVKERKDGTCRSYFRCLSKYTASLVNLIATQYYQQFSPQAMHSLQYLPMM